MARFKVAITKEVPFQGRLERFSNVYTYDSVPLQSDEDLTALVRRVRDIEKTVHANVVSFVQGQCWDVGLAPNYMRVSESWTGQSGAVSATAPAYAECALLLSWPLPRRQGLRRTVRRDLRKWIHVCSAYFGDATG